MNTAPTRSSSVAAPLVGTPIVPAAPTPADKPATAAAHPSPHRFAELLRRNRAEAPKPAPAPVHAARSGSAGGVEAGDTSAIEATATSANADKARAAAAKETSNKPTVRDGEPALDKCGVASGDDGTDGSDDSDRSGHATASMPPADRLDPRSVAQVAVDTLRRLASSGSAAVDDAAGSAGDDRDAAAATGKATALGHARGMASVDAANDSRAPRVDAGREDALRVVADARFQLAPDEAPFPSDPPAPAHARGPDALAASPGVGGPSPGADPAAAPGAATSLALPTPVDAPDFAATLGVRVSLLVQDGVQQAELHLNPAETGPVSIHITLDGTAARVDFGADVAATRAAIERGLPELASALRDAGFTLAGGGVSQHAGGRAGSDDAGRATPRVDAGPIGGPIATDSRAVVRTLAAGGVDLYA